MAPRRVRLDESGRALQEAASDPTRTADCGCPRLDPDDWHDVESDWSDIEFVRTHTTAVFGVPVGIAGLRGELKELARAAGAEVTSDAMLLFGEGRFRRPVMLEIERAEGATGGTVVRPGGIAFTRLVPAPFGQVRKLADEFRDEASERFGRAPDALWLWYLTCRECSAERDFETLFVAHYASVP